MRILEKELDSVDLECLRYLETMPDDEIDCSEIPEVTDWTGWIRGCDGKPVDSPFELETESTKLERPAV